MKPLRLFCLCTTVTSFILIAGCLTTTSTSRFSKPEALMAPLSKLMLFVQGTVRYPDPDNPIPDDRLIDEAKKQTPEFAEAFAWVNVFVLHDATNVVLLVCPTNRNIAWLEDSSWQPGVDKLHYRSNPPSPAKFTIPLPGTKLPQNP